MFLLANTHYFVWRVKSKLREKFLDNLYHAALNLRQLINGMAELLLEVSTEGSWTCVSYLCHLGP
jgi:DNA-directed RNA polymerase III subunit RPC3